MNPREAGFLLLTSRLGDPERKPLTVPQLRKLALRVRSASAEDADRELEMKDLTALGYSREQAAQMLRLLEDRELLEYYLQKARRAGCVPLTRAGEGYPLRLRKRLGEDSPGCLWAKGDQSLLNTPCVALVGSRELNPQNREFARKAGICAAQQGFTLVSGNARGADKTAQDACLKAGGSVICVVADSLTEHPQKPNVLWLSEDGYEEEFSAQRALSRNRVIHSLGSLTLVAQASLGTGGTWNGTVRNLSSLWSDVYCFRDGSEAADQLCAMGAQRVDLEDLDNLAALHQQVLRLLID